MTSFQNARRLVIKVGTSSLTYETGLINIRQVEQLCRVLADLKNSGRDIILVSSGSIAVGTSQAGDDGRQRVVIAKLDFFSGNGVVFVDNGDDSHM